MGELAARDAAGTNRSQSRPHISTTPRDETDTDQHQII